MMSEETAFQLDGRVVTSVLLVGVPVIRGLTLSAAVTSVNAVFADPRLYHETLMLPCSSVLRTPGRKCQPAVLLLSRTGLDCTPERLTSLKLCRRMSPARWKRASFQTMLTV